MDQSDNEQVNSDGLDIQKTRDLLARQGVPVARQALPDFLDPVAAEESQQDPHLQELRNREWTGKDYAEFLRSEEGGKFKFSFDDTGREAFKKYKQYMADKTMEFVGPAEMALRHMGQEIGEGISNFPNPLTDPAAAAATTAEGAFRGLRDLYGVLWQSEDPSSPLFKFRSWATALVGKDDGDIDSQMRQFHMAREHNAATYEQNSVLASMLPESWRDGFSSKVNQKGSIGLAYIALDLPEMIMSAGASTPASAARIAAMGGSHAARVAKSAKVADSWIQATAGRYQTFAQRVAGGALESAGGVARAPFKAMYGTSQAAAQLAGDYAGNAVRNMATAEIVEAGATLLGSTAVHPVVGFMRSFGAEALGEVMQVAGADMVDRALGKTMVRADSLGATTLERLAAGTAKGADAMSREAQILAKGINATIGWAPSLSGAALKAAYRDGMFGAALGYANSPSEGTGAGIAMGTAWGGFSGSVRHLHSYTHYAPQDSRVVDNFRDYVIPAFGRVAGSTSMEMAKRFYDHVNSFGDLRTSSIELSHISTLVAHEASLVGEGNVMFYFGKSDQEFSNVLAESNVKGGDYDKLMDSFRTMGSAAGMFEKVTMNDGTVKRLIAINSDLYKPTTGRHEISHALFRSVVEANAEMDSVIDKATGRYMGDVFNPAYASRIFGTSKDMGVMPDAAWESLMTSYGAARDWTDYGKPSDPEMVKKIGEMAKANYGTLLTRLRDHLNKGVDMQKFEVMDDFRTATNMAEEAFAYYASGTSNVFPVDKYVKDPAARNLLRSWAENRAARKNSRILSGLEEAGVEIKAKFTNTDGSPKILDDNGNPAIETYMFDDGVVVRTPGMDSWVESVLKQAYARSEVLVSTLDPMRQEAFAKEHGKVHLFKSLPSGGMRLKSPSELDEASQIQANKILSAIQGVSEDVRPVIESMPDGSVKLRLETANAETMAAIQSSGALTPQEFNELSAIVKIAEKNRMGDVTFNVMTGTLLAHSKQVRKAGGVYRLTGSDVPVTYRTFMPYAVEVNLKTHDSEGNPLRAAKGGILIHSVDVAAVNRRLMKTFKRADVRSIFNGNFSEFVDRFNLYVSNQSGLNGAKVPSADLFRAEYGDRAERVRDIMYEAFGGRKRKDDAFINTPADGYIGGADDPNRPFFTMRLDTLADIKVHPTSWNVHSKVQPFPFVHVQGYDGIARNFQITGFTERDIGNGKKYLKDNNGFEVYETKTGFALYDPFGIKISVFKTAKAAMKRAGAEVAHISEADLQPASVDMINMSSPHDEALAKLESTTESLNVHVRYQLSGLVKHVKESSHGGKSVVDHLFEYASKDSGARYSHPLGDVESSFSKKFIPLVEILGEAAGDFNTTIEVDGKKYDVSMRDTQIAFADEDTGVARGTEVVGTFQNELLRVDKSWFKHLYNTDKELLSDQLARRMAIAVKYNALHKAGKVNLPTAMTASAIQSYRRMGELMAEAAGGDRDTRDENISKLLAKHGEGMAQLGADIDWSFFEAGDPTKANRSKQRGQSTSSFNPSTFTKGVISVPDHWQAALNAIEVDESMASLPDIEGMAIGAAIKSAARQAYGDKLGGMPPVYLDVSALTPDPKMRPRIMNALMQAGGRAGEFLEFHSSNTGIRDIQGAIESYLVQAEKHRPTGVDDAEYANANKPMREGMAKQLISDYSAAVKRLAAGGGMFQKSVAGFFDKQGKLRQEAGTKKGFITSAVIADFSNPDVQTVVSMTNLFTALREITKEISKGDRESLADHQRDYIRVLSLIMRVTNDSSLIFHEMRTLDDRGMKPGMSEIRAKSGLFNGGHNQGMDFYTLPPSIGEVVTSTSINGQAKKRNIAYVPVNVNRQPPGRALRIAEERGMHVGSSGIPAMIAAQPKGSSSHAISIADVSHIVGTSTEVRAFMSNTSGKAMSTIDPSSLKRGAGSIIPGGNAWDGIMPPMALQFFASKDGPAKLMAMMPDAKEATKETLLAHMSLAQAMGIMRKVEDDMVNGGEIRSGEISSMLKEAGVYGDNMMFVEQVVAGYADTASSDHNSRMAGVLRIGQYLAAQENYFKHSLDSDSFPSNGSANRLLEKLGVDTAKTPGAGARYVDMLRQFIRTGSVADVDGDYRMAVRTLDGPVDSQGSIMGVGYGSKKIDSVQSSKLMMLTGSQAIAKLDDVRKREMEKLGLIGRMVDHFGNSYDYFEISDRKAELSLQKFGGRIDGMLTAGIYNADEKLNKLIDQTLDTLVSDSAVPVDASLYDEFYRSFNSKGYTLGDIITHPELYAFYPNLEHTRFELSPNGSTCEASYSPMENIFRISPQAILVSALGDRMKKRSGGVDIDYQSFMGHDANVEYVRGLLLHEMQHAIQEAEKFYQAGHIYTASDVANLANTAAGRPDRLAMAAGAYAASVPNLPILLGGPEPMGILDSPEKQLAPWTGLDEHIVAAMRTYHRNSAKLVSHVRDASGKLEIIRPDDATATKEIQKILNAPLAHTLISEFIPRTIAYYTSSRMKAESTMIKVLAGLSDGIMMADAVAYFDNIIKTAERNIEEAKVLAEAIKVGDFSSAQNAAKQVSLSKADFDRIAIGSKWPSSVNALQSYDPTLIRMSSEVSLGATLTVASIIDEADAIKAPWGFKAANTFMKLLEGVYYGTDPDEIMSNVTADRSRMSESELAASPRGVAENTYERVARLASNNGENLGQSASSIFRNPPKLNMIGGSVGAEKMNVSPFGESANNLFAGGMRMLARASLLGHYVHKANAELKHLGKLMYTSRGWHIGDDGLPVYISETGFLAGSPLLGQFGGDVNNLAANQEQVIRAKHDESAARRNLTEEQRRDLFGNAKDTDSEDVIRFGKLLVDKSFIPTQMYKSGDMGFLGGISRDGGKTVTISDIAAAMGAKHVIEEHIGMSSRALNAIYKAEIPEVVESHKIVETFRAAGLSYEDINVAHLDHIEKNFKGVKFTRGELADMIAMIHDVPLLDVSGRGNTIPAIMRDMMSGVDSAEQFRKLYRAAMNPDAPNYYAPCMRAFINESLSGGNSNSDRAMPLRSLLKVDSTTEAGAGRFFLMEAIVETIQFNWNANEYIQRFVGGQAGKDLTKRIANALADRFPEHTDRGGYSDRDDVARMNIRVETSMDAMGQTRRGNSSDFITQASAYYRFASRLERLLVELTPFAEKLAQKMEKSIRDTGEVIAGSSHTQRFQEMLAAFYSEALTAGLKDVVVSRVGEDGQKRIELSSREFQMMSQGKRSFYDGVKVNETIVRRGIGSPFMAEGSSGSVLHGLVGGASEAFAASARAYGLQSVMAGTSVHPTVPALSDTAYKPDKVLRNMHRSITFGPGPDVPDTVNLTNGDEQIAIGLRSAEGGMNKAEASLSTSLYESKIPNADYDSEVPAYIRHAQFAQRALMIRANDLFKYISSMDGEEGLDKRIQILAGSSRIRGASMRELMLANPDTLRILTEPNIGEQSAKALGFLRMAETIDQQAYNIGLGNVTGIDQGSWDSIPATDRRDAGGYKPQSQAALVRHYTREGALVVTSAYEALGSTMEPHTASLLNGLTSTAASKKQKAVASEPLRVVSRTSATGHNLLAEFIRDAEAEEAERVVNLDYTSADYEQKMLQMRIPRIARILGDFAAEAGTRFSVDREVVADPGLLRYVVSRSFDSKDSLPTLIQKEYYKNGFIRNIAHTLDGTIPLLAAAQLLEATHLPRNTALSKKLRMWLKADKSRYHWHVAEKAPEVSDSQKLSLISSMSSAMAVMSVAHMRRPFMNSFGDMSSPMSMEVLAKVIGGAATESDNFDFQSMARMAQGSMLNSVSIDAIKQFATLTGLAETQRTIRSLRKTGVNFNKAELLAIEAAVGTIAKRDVIDRMDADAFIHDVLGINPDTNTLLGGRNNYDLNWAAAKDRLSPLSLKKALVTTNNWIDASAYQEVMAKALKGLSEIDGATPIISRNATTGKYILPHKDIDAKGFVIDSSLHGGSMRGVFRLTDHSSIEPMKMDTSILEPDVREARRWADDAAYEGVGADDLEPGKYMRTSHEPIAAKPYDGGLGAVGAMFMSEDPIDLIEREPVMESGNVQIQFGNQGRSAIPASVIRGFVQESIIGRAQKDGAKTIEIAPAGQQLSYGGLGVSQIGGFSSAEGVQEASAQFHGRGMRSISKTTFQTYGNDKRKQPTMLTMEAARLRGFTQPPSGSNYGTGYISDPHRAGEFAPKKGYAWKRLPDGRIMINLTGDHLGYKQDYQVRGAVRAGYGFSLSEGVGYDPNSGLLIPGNMQSQATTSDFLGMMKHPLASAFSQKDPMMMQAIIDSAVRDSRGMHHTRGKIDPMQPILEGIPGHMLGSMERDQFKAFLLDTRIPIERRAFHAATMNDINGPSSYTSFILPAGTTTENLASILMAMHVEPTLGGAFIESATRERKHRLNVGHEEIFKGDAQARGIFTMSQMEGDFGIVPSRQSGAYTKGILSGLEDNVHMGMSVDPHLMDDVYLAAHKIISGESGYFLPDTERTLSMNGDTGLAIAQMFPGRKDLLAHSWDSKAAHGIKVWKRTNIMKDENFRAFVVEMNHPSSFGLEGGLQIGRKAVAFKTEAEAIAFSNKLSSSMTEASVLRALAGGDFRIVERPDEGKGSKFFAEAKVREIERLQPSVGFSGELEGTGKYRVGDLDMAMDVQQARQVGKALGRNFHLEFDTPAVKLEQITGSSIPELEDMVRQKVNFGLPQGVMNFGSRAMNAIIRGLPGNNRDFQYLNGTEWFSLLTKNGVSKAEIRQTGLGHLLANNPAAKFSRQDMAEFMAAVYPTMRRSEPAMYLMHAAQQASALGFNPEESVKPLGNNTFVPPFIHDSRLQSRANQLMAVDALLTKRLELTTLYEKVSSEGADEATKAKLADMAGFIEGHLRSFAEKIGVFRADRIDSVSLSDTIHGKLAEIVAKEGEPFASYDFRQLEQSRHAVNDRIKAFASDAAIRAILGPVADEIGPYISSLVSPNMPHAATKPTNALAATLEAGKSTGFGWNSDSEDSLGQSMHYYGSFPYTSYIASPYQAHHQAIVRYADKEGLSDITTYLKEVRDNLKARKEKISRMTPGPELDAEKQKYTSEIALQQTIQRVAAVRLATSKRMAHDDNRNHGTHFERAMPGNSSMSGGGGAYELGHSRTGWGMMTSALGIDGFATLTGIDPNGDLPLAFRREPISLLEEIQSDIFQKVDKIVPYSDPDMFLPTTLAEQEAFGRSSELAKLNKEYKDLLALANDSSRKAAEQLSTIIGTGSGGISTGTKDFDILASRLFLDQTDIFQRSMMHEAVPALLKRTGRTAKVPDRIRESISRMTNGQVSPTEVFVYDFDHELIDAIRSYPSFGPDTVDSATYEKMKQRMIENITNAEHADPSMRNPRSEQMKDKMLRDMRTVDGVAQIAKKQLEMTAAIINRGVEAMRNQGLDALKKELDMLEAAGATGEMHRFVSELVSIGRNSSKIGDLIATHVVRSMIKDEKLATELGGHIDGTGAVDYEGLVDRTIERIRKDYADSKSYIGKSVLIILDELKRRPAQARPHSEAAKSFSNVLHESENALASRFKQALVALDVDTTPQDVADTLANCPEVKGDFGQVWVRVNPVGQLGLGTAGNVTFRTFDTKEQFVAYGLALKKMGISNGAINVYTAPYHRHNGSAAGDFAKNVVEIYSAMSGGPKFLEAANRKADEIAAMRKVVKETFSPNKSGHVSMPDGEDITVFPDSMPFAEDGAYKTSQLIMNVLDSMNHGQHGMGIMDATYQIQRGGGIATPAGWLRIGGSQGHLLSLRDAGMPKDMTMYVSGAILAWEKNTGKSVNGPEGPHSGFFHRLATLEVAQHVGELTGGKVFTHGGQEGKLADHFKIALTALGREAEKAFPDDWMMAYRGRVGTYTGAPINLYGPISNRVHIYEGKKVVNKSHTDKITTKVGSEAGLFVAAGANSNSAGWGYIANYGLPQYALELAVPGSTEAFKLNYSLDSFERPSVNVDGNWLVLTDASGKVIEKIDQTQASPRQLEAFREMYLQSSKYRGNNWMVRAFLKEFGPAGAYVDFGTISPTSIMKEFAGSFPTGADESVFGDMDLSRIKEAIRAKYIEKGLIGPQLTEKFAGENMPSGMAGSGMAPSRESNEAVTLALVERGMINQDQVGSSTMPMTVADKFEMRGAGLQPYGTSINPMNRNIQPLMYRSDPSGTLAAGIEHKAHVDGLVKLFFPRAHLDPAASAAYVIRMTNPLTTTLVHSPLVRTKEMEIQFRRRVMEGIPLMQITGADVNGGESISTNGVKRLAFLLKRREMMPTERDERR